MSEKPKILIVDDRVENLITLKRILSSDEYELVQAQSGNEGLAKTLEHDFALALVDVQMPGMDGFEMVELLQQEKATSNLPVIFISAIFREEYHLIKGIETGAVDFMTKPIIPKILKGKVRVFINLFLQKRKLEQTAFELSQSLNKLRESEEKYRSVVDNLETGIALISPECEIISLNNKLQEWYPEIDITKESACFKTLGDASQEDICHECPVKKCFSDGRVYESTLKRISDGDKRIFRYITSPIRDNESRVTAAIIMLEEITEKKKMELRVIQAEKMMSVGSLAVGMAHEINNPLGGIIIAAQNITRRFSSEIDNNKIAADECNITLEQLQTYIKKRQIDFFVEGIRNDAIRAANIMADILQFSRKTSSNTVFADMPEVIEQAIRLAQTDYDLKKKYDLRKVEIIREFESELPKIPCVATEIEQVILSLFQNSGQAMKKIPNPDNPQIVVRLKLEPEMIRIEIEDNGPGMDQITQNRIFEPFFTTNDVGSGTGLGLSIVYFIITENHNGTIEVQSTSGVGTNFIIRLPLRRK